MQCFLRACQSISIDFSSPYAGLKTASIANAQIRTNNVIYPDLHPSTLAKLGTKAGFLLSLPSPSSSSPFFLGWGEGEGAPWWDSNGGSRLLEGLRPHRFLRRCASKVYFHDNWNNVMVTELVHSGLHCYLWYLIYFCLYVCQLNIYHLFQIEKCL